MLTKTDILRIVFKYLEVTVSDECTEYMRLEAIWICINLFSGTPDDINLIMGTVSDPFQDFFPAEFHILDLLNNLLKEQATYLTTSNPCFDLRLVT